VGGRYGTKDEGREVRMVSKSESLMMKIAVSKLVEPEGRIRLEIDSVSLYELSENIREMGLLQPLVVCKDGNKFEIVAGERRFLAIKKLGWDEIPCVVRKFSRLEKALARASENLNRANLSPIEEAAVYMDLLDEHRLTMKQIGDRMGKSGSYVKDRIALMRMPEEVQQAIHRGKISPRVGHILCRIKDKLELFRHLEMAVENGVTAEIMQSWVNDWRDRIKYLETPDAGGMRVVEETLPEKTYAACQICETPVEYGDIKFIKVCGECLDNIVKSLNKKGK